MNVLIVYAQPEPKSLDMEMQNRALHILQVDGHAVRVSDLYAMRFKAAADQNDFTDPQDVTLLNMQEEQKHAAATGTFSQDILTEQQKVTWADLILFQFPLWWYSIPAILKGWVDRVFAYGFAYGAGKSLQGKRALCVVTTGGPPRPYTPEKRVAVNEILDHFQRGMLHFCGLDVLPPFAVYGAQSTTPAQREQFLLQYTQFLRSFDEMAPIDFSKSYYRDNM